MSHFVRFRPGAEADALETRDWYEGRQTRLGAMFGAALDETIANIAEGPLVFLRVHGDTRRAILNRFPYAVYFRIADNEIIVLAVHGRQDPTHWQSRT